MKRRFWLLRALWFIRGCRYKFIYGTNDKNLMNKFVELTKKRGE